MKLLEAVLKLTVQLFIFFVTLTVNIVSGIVRALWQAWLNRAPRNAPPSNLKRAIAKPRRHYPHKGRKQWRRR